MALDNFLGQLMQGLGVEWWLECAHLVKQNAEGPNVRFETVRLRLDDLWRQVIWCTHNGLGLGPRVTEYSSDTEISQLDEPILGDEDVL